MQFTQYTQINVSTFQKQVPSFVFRQKHYVTDNCNRFISRDYLPMKKFFYDIKYITCILTGI